jgi:hypothetical protein
VQAVQHQDVAAIGFQIVLFTNILRVENLEIYRFKQIMIVVVKFRMVRSNRP